ncbi:hypothetical protein B0H11DRAFT_1973216, partial [Mycena galericulata]
SRMGRTLRPIRRYCFLLLLHDQSTRSVTSPTRLLMRAYRDSRASSSGETGQSQRPHPPLLEFLPPTKQDFHSLVL